MVEVRDKRFVVVGLGVTGLATARYLTRRGASVVVTDSAAEEKLGDMAAEARDLGTEVELGGHLQETFTGADHIVISPGVPLSLPELEQAESAGTPIWGEIELAAAIIQKPLVAVTGTNGKTTVTTLIGEMLKKSGRHVFVGGNIGQPLITFADKGENADVAVVEVSSFQLETIRNFRPAVAVLLNIAEDHLDRYDDFDDYAKAKKRIFENQQEEDVAVINGSDFHVLQAAKDIKSRKQCFNGGRNVKNGTVTENGVIKVIEDGTETGSIEVPVAYLRTPHNMENTAASVLAALAAGGTMAGVRAAVGEFSGLAHRLEYVDMIDNVAYIDDSKATNPDAVRRALECFDVPVILLLGGEDKGCDFNVLKNVIREHTKAVVVFGQAREQIQIALDNAVAVWMAVTLAEAVEQAASLSRAGEVVLLSPACSSFDMYDSYAQRGEDFRKAVERLKTRR